MSRALNVICAQGEAKVETGKEVLNQMLYTLQSKAFRKVDVLDIEDTFNSRRYPILAIRFINDYIDAVIIFSIDRLFFYYRLFFRIFQHYFASINHGFLLKDSRVSIVLKHHKVIKVEIDIFVTLPYTLDSKNTKIEAYTLQSARKNRLSRIYLALLNSICKKHAMLTNLKYPAGLEARNPNSLRWNHLK